MKWLSFGREHDPQSDLYRAGYAMGMAAGIMIERGHMMPPDRLLPKQDSPGEWCDGYSAGLYRVSNKRNWRQR